MEQLTQRLRNGEMRLVEVPCPVPGEGQVLVRNRYSVISPGTEGKTVHDARLGYIGKARARKDELRKVIDTARTYGLRDTYRMVMNRLEAPVPLGYSCAGEVIATGAGVTSFRVGDRVACGGNNANHAEIVAVPVNLCVPVPGGVSLRHAAFCTLGAVALQGVRQADLRLGESAVVIGLGLVGQLTLQLLRAGGIRAAGIDLDESRVRLAVANGCALALRRDDERLEAEIEHWTSGLGADAVVLTAGASDTDPVDLAGTLCRQKGKVVVVGNVPTGFRRPAYYRKELDLRMSCSYGPGRYDPAYEDDGIDYPAGYVRWTENRNMRAFAELLAGDRLAVDPLVTKEFDFADAPAAYDLLMQKSEPLTALVLRYGSRTATERTVRVAPPPAAGAVRAGLIGAGSFAQNFLLPNLPAGVARVAVATARGHTARHAAAKWGFSAAATDAQAVIADPAVNTVFIATRHDSHAGLAIDALRAGKNVYVEKPLALTPGQLEAVREACESPAATNGKAPAHAPALLVGFNRRFAPFTRQIQKSLETGLPRAIQIRINAGKVPPGHWIDDPHAGGGRIVGEVCHFTDWACCLAPGIPRTVHAVALEEKGGSPATLAVNLSFTCGSIASLSYFSNGDKRLPKEFMEVFCGGTVAQLTDFRELTLWGRRRETFKSRKADKGHAACLQAFVEAVSGGRPSPVPFDALYRSSLIPFRIIESIQSGQAVSI